MSTNSDRLKHESFHILAEVFEGTFNQNDCHGSMAWDQTMDIIKAATLRAVYTVDAGIPFSEFIHLEKSSKRLGKEKIEEAIFLEKYLGDALVCIAIARWRANEIVQAEEEWLDRNIVIQDMLASLKGGESLVNPFEEPLEIQKAFLDDTWGIPDDFPRDQIFENSINDAFVRAGEENFHYEQFMERLLANYPDVYHDRFNR